MNEKLELKKLSSEHFHKNREKKALVCHPNKLVRSAIIFVLSELGIQSNNVSIVTDSFKEAEESLAKFGQQIVICPSEMGGQEFPDLLHIHEKLYPNRLDCLFVVVGKEGSLSSATILLDHFIDSYLVTPLSPQSLTNTLVDLFTSKYTPGPVALKFNQARALFIAGKYPQAEKQFRDLCMPLATRGIACSFLGKIKEIQGDEKAACEFYEVGSKLENPSYAGLKNYAHLLVTLKKYAEADVIAKIMLEKFPFNPSDSSFYMKLFVANQNPDNILGMIDVISQAENVDAKIKNYLAAGLVIGAKLFFEAGDVANAIGTIKNACELSKGNEKVLEKACLILADFKQKDLALKLLCDNSGAHMKKSTFLALQLEINHRSGDHQGVMKLGQELLRVENVELRAFQAFFNSSKALNMAGRQKEAIVDDVIKKYPEYARKFV